MNCGFPILTAKSQKFFLFTVDVEDWFQVENFKASIPFDTWNERELRVEENTHRLLDLLDEGKEGKEGSRIRGAKGPRIQGVKDSRVTNIWTKNSGVRSQESESEKLETGADNVFNESNQQTNSTNEPSVHATFFVLGWIAKKLPVLVREIHARGHEVASHGVDHGLCTQVTSDELRKDLSDSRAILEDIIGGPVQGYRAPSFSINNDILKIIEDAGYQYDSSYNSFDKHGRYGKLSTKGFLKNGIAYKVSDNFYELPVSNLSLRPSTFDLQAAVLPFGGGGYFRLFPYIVFKKGIQRILRKEDAYNFYLHPWEVDPGQPRVERAPAFLKFRHYVNLASTASKIKRMLSDFKDCRFVTCGKYVEAVAGERL